MSAEPRQASEFLFFNVGSIWLGSNSQQRSVGFLEKIYSIRRKEVGEDEEMTEEEDGVNRTAATGLGEMC